MHLNKKKTLFVWKDLVNIKIIFYKDLFLLKLVRRLKTEICFLCQFCFCPFIYSLWVLDFMGFGRQFKWKACDCLSVRRLDFQVLLLTWGASVFTFLKWTNWKCFSLLWRSGPGLLSCHMQSVAIKCGPGTRIKKMGILFNDYQPNRSSFSYQCPVDVFSTDA